MARTQQEMSIGETFADRMSLAYTTLCRQRQGQILKLELTEFGQRIGSRMMRPAVSPAMIMEWFAGTVPDVATVQAVAEVCGVDPGWLAFGSASGAPAPRVGQPTPGGSPQAAQRRSPNGMLIKFGL